jgi:hypothetical protein
MTAPIDALLAELRLAIEELRELARGIHPAILTEEGIAGAVASLADRSAVPVRIERAPDGRFPDAVEATVYFVVAECLANVANFAFGLRDLSVFNRAFEGVHIGSDVLVGTDTGQPRDDPSKVRGSRLYPAVRDPNGATISPWQRRPCGGEHQIGSEQLHQGHPGGLGFAQIDGQELGRRARILQGGVRADTR